MVSLQSLKIASEKVELIQDTLDALDEATSLISAFTQTEENQALLSKLLENIDDVKTIVESVDLMETTTEDITKGTFLGSRKTDIDIALNKVGIAETLSYEEAMAIWTDTSNTVYYTGATATFTDGAIVEIPFVNDDLQAILVSTHGGIVDQLMGNASFTAKLQNTSIQEEVGGKTGTILRITDTTGTSSNIERITLHASTGNYVNQHPIYYWALTTSALQTLANRVGDIIALGNDIDKIIVLSSRIDEMLDLQNSLSQLVALHSDLTGLMEVHSNLAEVLQADENASIATAKALEASNIRDEIHNVSVGSTITGASGTPASVVYNPTTGQFTFIVPQGIKGDKGEAFEVNAVGLIANRTLYDTQQEGFSFLAIDEATIYFKLSNTSGDWSLGAPFGKGETGDTGEAGRGIATIVKTNTTGSVDTYTITYTDATTSTFTVTNANINDETTSLTDTWSSSKISAELDNAFTGKETLVPTITIAGSFNENTSVQGTITVDTDSIVQGLTATIGTVSGLTKLNSITWLFNFTHDVTDGNDDTVTFSCYATKAGELRSDEATATATVVYVPIVADDAFVDNLTVDDSTLNDGWSIA